MSSISQCFSPTKPYMLEEVAESGKDFTTLDTRVWSMASD